MLQSSHLQGFNAKRLQVTVVYKGATPAAIGSSSGTIDIGSTAGLPIVVAFHSRSAVINGQITPSTVLVDGSAVTVRAQNAAARKGAAIASGSVLKSGSIAFSAECSDVSASVVIHVFMAYALASTTPVDTSVATGDNPTAILDTNSGGLLVSGAINANSSGVTFTFTGLDTIDVNADNGSFSSVSAGHSNNTAAVSNHNVQATSASTEEYIVAVSYA